MMLTQSGALVVLLAGSISHTSLSAWISSNIFNVSLVCLLFILPVLVGVGRLLCLVVAVILECYKLFSGVRLRIRSCCFIK